MTRSRDAKADVAAEQCAGGDVAEVVSILLKTGKTHVRGKGEGRDANLRAEVTFEYGRRCERSGGVPGGKTPRRAVRAMS